MSVLVLVEAHARPESADDLGALLTAILPATRAYDGCEGVTAHRGSEDDNVFVLVETWASKAHYDRYLAWREETGDLARLIALVAEEPSIRFFAPLGA